MIRPDDAATGQSSCWRFRLTHGQDVLDAWSDTASQPSRNAVYRLLFAVQDGSVFRRYQTIDDAQGFAVRLNGDLVVRIRLEGEEAFAIASIASAGEARCLPRNG